MGLQTYNAKRRFDQTPEPQGEQEKSEGHSFVVQKHDARRLHYDFRLEMDGVLKSWAVTRGPSLNPDDKRLAVHVEDHPLSYGEFEGVIPKGQYGGGTVVLWDKGTWHPVGDAKKGYKKGHLEFELQGEKLRGRWHLVRMHGKPEEKRENWLLIKVEDEEARTKADADILDEKPDSVKSGRSIKAIAQKPEDTWNSKPVGKRTKTQAPAEKQAHDFPKGARKAKLPDFVQPALASLKPKPPAGDRWLHEIKFDGYRIQVRIDNGTVTLLTRSGLDWTEKFGTDVAKSFAALPVETALLDGEIVVERDNGASDFSALQHDLSEGRTDRFRYYAFDLLHLDGHDLQNAGLIDRKHLLEKLIPSDNSILRYSEHFGESGEMILDHACRLSLEGVISKLRDSKYQSGRKGQWVKSKCSSRQEFVIGGFTVSSTSDQAIGSLAVGVYDEEGLHHVGRVGTGFTADVAENLFKTLSPLTTKTSPFADKLTALAKRDLVFVKPERVAEVEFRTWSADGNLRHASFRGLRDDKHASEIKREDPKSTAKSVPKTSVTFTHPDRLYWPKDGVTKEGLADYYAQVWHLMAPYIVDRPLSLMRCPDGIEGPHFFQKHPWQGMNRAVSKIADPKDKQGDPLIRITDFDGLMALVQSAALEIHPWGATVKSFEKPDMITMDLDPGENISWEEIISAAENLKQRFEDVGLAAFVKTSGGKGLHVVSPLKPQASWVKVKSFAKAMATDMAKSEPDAFIAVSTKAKRNGRIFIDYLRNGRGNTAVAPYSTRARPGAAISMPVSWAELSNEIGPDYFTVGNIANRLGALKHDPWDGFFDAARPLP
ncbi:DNA ligase D [Agrobacterium rubi]|uniref:DNA ligase (ATP) n=1 Tax=Agrobacterium rubi TaxID=28099 RepID=A0AAE7R9G9_9HYPH|nr:DNA ligase D [Agrobacterium rubi]NTE87169.1 DNA ligase D [Agrobacterium rubi]NTF03103.1 DNA ligase D [Agrobacterium rubi]NTF37347.1 DNA ligase D [Agrobacterium rubi]OCJ55095.1 DNA ligase [Agrobacterium rubi]QTF99763.1 DNA ligase D [Agrobacterium rubi]